MPTSSNRLLQVRLLSSIAKRPLPGATMAPAVSASSCLFIGPLPVGNVFSIDAELVGVILGSDLFVEQGLANAGAGDAETGHPIDSVNGQAEAVSLVTNGQFKWGIDVTLLLVAAHMDVVLTGAAV